jgi:ABC-type sugar transport system permease subunit
MAQRAEARRMRRPRGDDRSLVQQIVRARLAYLLLLPIFLSLAVFVYYPPISALYHAFFNWDPSGSSSFVGFANFQAMPQDPILMNSIWNLVRMLLFAVVVTTTVPLIVAELIFSVRNTTAQYAYRVLFVIPVVVPLIVIVLLWKFIYDPNIGLLNQLLGAIGLGSLQHAWLGEVDTALYAVMFLGFPWVTGTSVLIYLAGLMAIPTEVLEAAALDGVTGLRRVWSIDLPLLVGQIKLFVVLGIIAGVQQFEIQYVLTQGGPAWATEVPGLRMYQAAFEDSRLGYAAAIGLVLFVVVLIMTVINFRFIRSSVDM